MPEGTSSWSEDLRRLETPSWMLEVVNNAPTENKNVNGHYWVQQTDLPYLVNEIPQSAHVLRGYQLRDALRCSAP